MSKKILLFLFMMCSLILSASDSGTDAEAGIIGSADVTTTIYTAEGLSEDDLILADIPIAYGEEEFRSRILERTGGERDPIGLVLTGGSARAFAHLGVLEYMEENGIEPDFIISNSMGSIIAVLYAAGLSPQQIMSVITSGDLSTFFKLTLPVEGGILDPTGFKGLVESVVGADLQLEDLVIPVMVVSQDLVTKREIRIMEGTVSDVLIASFALPVYFPPQEYKGHLLLDGGIVNLAPISIAYDYSDTVIVSTTFYDNDELNLKNPLNIINTAFEIVKRQNAATDIRAHMDDMIWIRCGVEQFSFMDFGAAAEMSEIGYESAAGMADELSLLYKHGISQEILDNREIYQERIDKARMNQYYYSRVEQPQPSNTISLGIYSFQDSSYPYYLRNTFDIGLEYRWSSRMFEFSVLAGGAFDLTANKNTSSNFLISSSIAFYPVSRIRLSLYGAATFGNNTKWYIPDLYVRQGFDYKIYSSDLFSIEFNQAFEMYEEFKDGPDDDQLLLSAQFQGDLNLFDYARLDMNFGYIMSADSIDSDLHHYLQGGAETRLYLLPSLTSFYLDVGLFSRFAVDGQHGVPLYPSDGFLTNDTDLNAVPEPDSKAQSYFLLFPLSFGYAFTAAPSFGELLMADYLELSLYCDLLFNKWPEPEFSTGVELQFELSLIGLQNIPITIRAGYDSLTDGFIGSLRFTVTR